MKEPVSYREIDHTADLGVELDAPSRADLFAHAVIVLARLMVNQSGVRRRETRVLEIRADNDVDLLHDLLAAALNLFLTEEFIWCDAEVVEERGLLAVALGGEQFTPSRHELLTEIKGVTYHQMRFAAANGRWRARVIFDI